MTVRARNLIVCRTRAHQRAVLREAADDTLVWTFGDLWDRLAQWACLHRGIARDDLGTRLLAAATLADASDQGGAQLPRLTPAVDALRREFVASGVDAAELHALVQDSVVDPASRRADVARLLHLVGRVEQGLTETGVADDVLARRGALDLLRAGHWPHALDGLARITLHHPVDLFPLDLEVLQALGGRLPVEALLPVDDAPGRAVLVGAERLFARLEQGGADPAHERGIEVVGDGLVGDGPLAPLRAALLSTAVAGDAPATVALAADVEEEARVAVAAVAAWLRASPGSRVAVAARRPGLLDPTVRALERDGIPVRRRRRSLAESPAARLLLDLAALRTDGMPRDRLLAVLLNPARRGALHPDDAARLLTTLRRAAVRRDHEDATRPVGGYRRRLEQLRRRDPRVADDVDVALATIEPVMGLAATLPLRGRLSAHLDAWLALTRLVVDDARALGGTEVFEIIARLVAGARRIGDPPATVELHALARLVEAELDRQPWLDDDVDVDDDAVETLTTPELGGRRFDLVIVVGVVEGELPRPSRQTVSLLSDFERAFLNRRLGRPALSTEGGSAGDVDALETLWWLLAVKSATSRFIALAPRRESRGRELAASALLLDMARALGSTPTMLATTGTAGAPLTLQRDRRRRQLRQAVREADAGPDNVAPDDGATKAAGAPDLATPGRRLRRARTMARERQRFFADPGAPFEERRGPFAFAVDARRIARAFGHAFGLEQARPLTPTRLEALAECRLQGFVQHVLKLDVDPEPGNAIEARVAGTFAHTVLERFYKDRAVHGVRVDRFHDGDRARLQAIIDEETTRALQVASGHQAALQAALRFMKATLVRVVAAVSARPPVEGVEPRDFELQVGARAEGRAPDGPPAPIEIGDGRRIWIGGIIDRVDEGPTARAVVDYKTMSAARVREKAAATTLFESHFQLLVYLRLMEHHRPTPATTSLHGYLLSLKDGATSADIGLTPELRARVLDDSRVDGLGQGIGRVLLPILQGTLPPDAGVRCDECRLQRVCRVPLEGAFEPDPDEGDDDGGGP